MHKGFEYQGIVRARNGSIGFLNSGLVRRCSQHLSTTGVFIVRLSGVGTSPKENAVIDIIGRSLTVVEEYCSQKPQVAFTICR